MSRFIWDTTMTGDLGLRGNDLLIYSVIASFSQGRMGCFYGSQEMLGAMVGISRRAAIDTLCRLDDKGLISRGKITIEGKQYNAIMCATSAHRDCAKSAQVGVQNLHNGCEESAHNNKIYNDIDKSISKSIYGAAEFLKDLISLGVEPETAADWVAVRKDVKARNTRTAFDHIRKQIEASGYSAQQCVYAAAAKGWRGLEAEWVRNFYTPKGTGTNGQETRDAQRDAQAKATLDEYREKGMI